MFQELAIIISSLSIEEGGGVSKSEIQLIRVIWEKFFKKFTKTLTAEGHPPLQVPPMCSASSEEDEPQFWLFLLFVLPPTFVEGIYLFFNFCWRQSPKGRGKCVCVVVNNKPLKKVDRFKKSLNL